MRRQQCKGCPWRLENDPTKIPNGLKPSARSLLNSWTADPGSMHAVNAGMSCHESPEGRDALPCVGWAIQQLGDGNNIMLRVQALHDHRLQRLELRGDQRSLDEIMDAVE